MNKYHNIKVRSIDGEVFDSRKEERRWHELKMLERCGAISGLQRQPKFVLIPSQKIDGKVVERECAYIADFVYIDRKSGIRIVEDTKGVKTKDYIIKRKLMLWIHGIRVREI